MHSVIFAALFLCASNISVCGKQVTLETIRKELSLPSVEKESETHYKIFDGTNSITFNVGFRRLEINGSAAWLNGPANPDFKEKFTIDNIDLKRFLRPLLFGTPAVATNRPFCVFIDAGHGGEDSGATSKINNLYEKELNLDIAMRLGTRLTEAGFKVEYSRTNDTFISLTQRSVMAEKAKADIFVSIHGNMASGKAARGAETFTMTYAGFDSTAGEGRIGKNIFPGNAFDADSAILGHIIQTHLPGKSGDADRGLKHARFQVLRKAPCPAVLIETGFLSNEAEARNLASLRFREKFAKAVADGITAYYNRAKSGTAVLKTKQD